MGIEQLLTRKHGGNNTAGGVFHLNANDQPASTLDTVDETIKIFDYYERRTFDAYITDTYAFYVRENRHFSFSIFFERSLSPTIDNLVFNLESTSRPAR